ncbi:MAG: hypothetical protein ACXVZR_07685 [Terriglobales bacterium]
MARRSKRGTSAGVRILQIIFLVALVFAVVRLYFVFRAREKPAAQKISRPAARPLNREAYVVPRKLHAYDLASARELTKQPVWVQEGYRYTYYPFDPTRRRVDFSREVGVLGPIEELRIKSVLAQPTPNKPNYHQIVAIFDHDGRSYAVPVGTESGGSFQIYADQMFFYEDPHQLYNFWPAETWDAIRNHEVKPGMNEIQADFAVGMGVPQPEQSVPEEKVVKYANGGHPLTVTFRKGRAVTITQKD